jgi:hypothetical protein
MLPRKVTDVIAARVSWSARLCAKNGKQINGKREACDKSECRAPEEDFKPAFNKRIRHSDAQKPDGLIPARRAHFAEKKQNVMPEKMEKPNRPHDLCV